MTLLRRVVVCSWGTVAIATFVGVIVSFSKEDVDVHRWAERQARIELAAGGS